MAQPFRWSSSHQLLDSNEIPDEPVESYKRIINSKMVALEEQELNNQFETHGSEQGL